MPESILIVEDVVLPQCRRLMGGIAAEQAGEALARFISVKEMEASVTLRFRLERGGRRDTVYVCDLKCTIEHSNGELGQSIDEGSAGGDGVAV